ncbi:MAG: hypothetical protein H6772_01850 [Pseudomonadales bacterium]|nr:hypothetical protein [Pseudomonadales bacterium]
MFKESKRYYNVEEEIIKALKEKEEKEAANKRLNELIKEYYEFANKGIFNNLLRIITGKNKPIFSEISEIIGLDESEVTKMIGAIGLICMGSKSREDAESKVKDKFTEKYRENIPNIDENIRYKIEGLMNLSKAVINQYFILKDLRKSK